MKEILVLGIGNRMMEDDGIGVHVTEALKKIDQRDGIRCLAGETDIDYCLSELAMADQCILIDGSLSGKAAGSVCVYPLSEIYSRSRPLISFHDFDLIHAMKRENLLKDGILITIEVCSIGFSTELSPALGERFPEIVHKVKEIIDAFLLRALLE